MIDPLDESKPFGEHLSVILDTIIEQEASDFEEQLYSGNIDWMTEDEINYLKNWFKAWERGEGPDELPHHELYKTGHIWARAWLVADELNTEKEKL